MIPANNIETVNNFSNPIERILFENFTFSDENLKKYTELLGHLDVSIFQNAVDTIRKTEKRPTPDELKRAYYRVVDESKPVQANKCPICENKGVKFAVWNEATKMHVSNRQKPFPCDNLAVVCIYCTCEKADRLLEKYKNKPTTIRREELIRKHAFIDDYEAEMFCIQCGKLKFKQAI